MPEERLMDRSRKNSRMTMADIARLAGVNASTVSRALADSPRVVQETKDRIREIVRETGYVANHRARILRAQQSGQILVVLYNIAAHDFPEVVQGIEETTGDLGVGVLVGSTQKDQEREEALGRQLLSGAVDGIILLTGRVPCCVADMPDHDRRIISVSRQIPNSTIPFVTIDEVEAGEKALEYLMSLGHRQIAHIGGPADSLVFNARAEIYLSTMAQAGRNVRPMMVRAQAFDISAGMESMRHLLATGSRPTAVLCASDDMAIGAIREARREGLTVPDDISFVGYDDLAISAAYEPPLTTIRIPRRAMGREGAKMLMANLELAGPKPASRFLASELIVRSSCAAVAAA